MRSLCSVPSVYRISLLFGRLVDLMPLDDAICSFVPVAEMTAGRLSMMIAIRRVLILFMKFYSFGY